MHAGRFLILSVAVALATVAFATDRYVSQDGAYGSDISDAVCYTDLQTAVTAAQDDETVWVADGFVCASGIGGDKSRITVPNRRITIRSASGFIDEARNLGATVRGPGSACDEKDQARCVHFGGATAKMIGFVLEDGYPNANGGAVEGSASLLENCVIRNSKGKRGGGIATANCKNCVITNNVATEMGGGVYFTKNLDSCTIAHNTCSQYGGGVGTWAPAANTLVTNCCVYGNASMAQGGGLAFRGSAGPIHVVNCVISNNTCIGSPRNGGGCYGEDSAVRLLDCDIVDNIVTNGSGGGIYGCVATDCRIVRNGTISLGSTYTSGGGAYSCVLTNCVVSFNTNDCKVTGKMYSCGGGLNGGSAVECRFEGNFANYNGGAVVGNASTLLSKCLVTNNVSETGHGGGVYGANRVVDSVIVDNRAPAQRGGGLAGCTLVGNCLITGNRAGNGGGVSESTTVSNCWIAGNSAGSGGGAYGGALVNCTLTNNATSYRGGGFYDSTLSNCRVVGNLVTAGEAGGGWDGACYNCLIARNQGVGFKCWGRVSELVNCTITGNGSSGFTTSGSTQLRAINVISWGNGGTDKAPLISSNCCLTAKYTVAAGSVNIFSEDPRLTPDENGNLVPKNRRCRNVAGAILPWMTDPADARSFDLAGKPRVQGGAPELGCFEAKPSGLVVIFR